MKNKGVSTKTAKEIAEMFERLSPENQTQVTATINAFLHVQEAITVFKALTLENQALFMEAVRNAETIQEAKEYEKCLTRKTMAADRESL